MLLLLLGLAWSCAWFVPETPYALLPAQHHRLRNARQCCAGRGVAAAAVGGSALRPPAFKNLAIVDSNAAYAAMEAIISALRDIGADPRVRRAFRVHAHAGLIFLFQVLEMPILALPLLTSAPHHLRGHLH